MIPQRIQPILDETQELAEIFSGAGHRLFLVGGIVRNLLLGAELSDPDIDLTTDATPDITKRLISSGADSVWTQGEKFGTIGCIWKGRQIEITTHRAEAYESESRKPIVEFSSDIEADLSRRDFTVNAMALEITGDKPRLIDPFGGADHLIAKELHTPIGAEVSFSDDPLRMMRAARFIAGYGFKPSADTLAAVEKMADRLSIVSAERIRDELDKLMVVPDPSDGLWFLHDSGLSDHFFPELRQMRVEQDPIHRHKDVLTHTIAVVANTSPRVDLRLAALFHDIGKPKTRAIGENGVSFHHHEVVGARMTRDRMKALRYSKDRISVVSNLVYLHLRFHTYQMGWSDSAVRRFVRDAGDELVDLIELTRCDCTTRNKRKAEILSKRMDDLEARIAELGEQEELKKLRPDLDGQEVMDHLNLEPGREVGQALKHLLDIRINEGPLSKTEAYERLDAWWAEQ